MEVWRRWLSPPEFDDIHETRAAAILHPVLWVLCGSMVLISVAAQFVDWVLPLQRLGMVVATLVFVLLLAVLRRGHVAGVAVTVTAVVFGLGLSSMLNDGTSSVYPLPFVASIALAGVTIGPRSPLVVGALATAAIGVTQYLHSTGAMALRRPVEEWAVVATQIIVLWFMSGVMLLANRALTQAFETIDEQEAVRRSLESDLYRAQKLEAIAQLAGGFAHDFNNLLGVVMANAELLLMGDHRSPKATARSAEDIFKASRAASTLTSKFLALSRKQVVQAKVLDPSLLVEDFASVLDRMAGSQIRLEMNCPPGLGHIRVDPNELQQVVSNLVINAGQASPPGSAVRVCFERRQLAQRLQSVAGNVAPGDYLRLGVDDTGSGMDEATLKSAFEPFFTTKAEGRGSGLGLAVVWGVVRQCGGYISVASTPGEGSRFSVWFPIVEGPSSWEPVTVEDVETIERMDGIRVLFVDDDDNLRAALGQVLRHAGATVVDFASGAEALSHTSESSIAPDVLLTDVMMPTMNGPELVLAMRELGFGGSVVYVSGYAGSGEMQDHLDIADVVLRKPVAAQDLVASLRACTRS